MIKDIKVSANFKKMTTKAVASIVIFVLVYLLLVLLAIGLTIICAYGGILLISVKVGLVTLGLGVGAISMGVLILIFLLKFMFAEHKVDRTNLTEITKEQEPKLFEFIKDVVAATGTNFPKKVYLSSDVNACVFYDSSFWSMFLPIPKNLQIGMGLVTAVTETEFKAILAHEFGHFSQRSMKVGSYVHNVNQVIFNMLFNNDSYNSMIERWGNFSGYFGIFVIVAIKIIQFIQFLLGKMYKFINLNYLGLSREMEFHADEVAANVVGGKPLVTSLLRTDFALESFTAATNYFGEKASEGIKSENLFTLHQFVLQFLAKENKLPVKNGYPIITLETYKKQCKSNLIVEDQWASHPSTEERVLALERLNIDKPESNNNKATGLFIDIELTQKNLTEKLFSVQNYSSEILLQNEETFAKEYAEDYKRHSLNPVYNGYYDQKKPEYFDIENIDTTVPSGSLSDFFSSEKIELVNTSLTLGNDIFTLTQILEKTREAKVFFYEGKRYSASESTKILPLLKAELEKTNFAIVENDKSIYTYMYSIAKKYGKESELAKKYKRYVLFEKDQKEKMDVINRLAIATDFFNVVTPYKVIEKKLKEVKKIEVDFKAAIEDILTSDLYQHEIKSETKEVFENYIEDEWNYFIKPNYNQAALNKLQTAMQTYYFLFFSSGATLKKDLLNFQDELFERQHNLN